MFQLDSRSTLIPDTPNPPISIPKHGLSEIDLVSTFSPSSPNLIAQQSFSLLNKQQHEISQKTLENILKADGDEDGTLPSIYIGEDTYPKRANDGRLFQGYSTIQLAGSLTSNVSQSILYNASTTKNQDKIQAADLMFELENRQTTTAAGRDAEETTYRGDVNQQLKPYRKDDVTSELYSQFDMEVLRKKIEKRIS